MMIKKDKSEINEVFALSKKAVAKEQDDVQQANYHRLSFEEFLEFIGRMSVHYFEETEMEDITF